MGVFVSSGPDDDGALLGRRMLPRRYEVGYYDGETSEAVHLCSAVLDNTDASIRLR